MDVPLGRARRRKGGLRPWGPYHWAWMWGEAWARGPGLYTQAKEHTATDGDAAAPSQAKTQGDLDDDEEEGAGHVDSEVGAQQDGIW